MRKLKLRIKHFQDIGIRLTTYGDENRGGRIDLFHKVDPTDIIFEGHFMHKQNAIDQYNELTSKTKAINWGYRNC